MRRKKKFFTKKRREKIIGLIISIIIIVAGYINYNNIRTEKIDVGEIPENYEIKETDLQIYFFNVGQADSILLINNNQKMLIDAGNNEDGKRIAKYIKKLGISKINYLIGTHIHEDHIGGLDEIINEFEIDNIYLPYTSNKSKITTTYEDVLNSVKSKKMVITQVNIGDTFNVGEAKSTVLFVDNKEPAELNNSSICIRTEFKNQSYLFMGDLGSSIEEKNNWPNSNVLKVAHHGSRDSSSQYFLSQVNPEISIISVAKENDYGHPHQETIVRLEQINTNIFRTDEMGTILLISDGETNKIKKLQTKLNGN